MTTLAIICGSFIALWFATIIVAAVIKGALTKSPFRPRKTDHDKERNLASRTLRRIHP